MKNVEQLEKELLTPEACAFLKTLHRKFHSQARALVADRLEARYKLLSDENLDATWPPKSQESAFNSDWKVAQIPRALQDRTVEITGPAEPKMIINALNCGANVFMADFEDSLSPTWAAALSGHKAIAEAYKRSLRFQSGENVYELKKNEAELATLKLRPRGWHLPEPRFLVDGQAGSGALFDFGLSLFLSGKTGVETGRGPFYYLPKLESPMEARLWAEVFQFSETALGLPRNSIRATVLIETLPAALAMEQILFELRSYIIGFNAGRWDYLFSIIKTVIGTKHEVIFPDRKILTMDVPFMRRYAERIVDTCVRRGAQPIGGMSALIPNRKDVEQNARALEIVGKDKDREARQGFIGTWVAHPDLVPVAREAFELVRAEKVPNHKWKFTDAPLVGSLLPRADEAPFLDGGKLLRPTLSGVRMNIDVSLRYIGHWLGGLGAVAIHGLMEDAATAEISRSQLWQWHKHATKLETGETVTADWLTQMIIEISCELLALIKKDSNSLSIAESDLKRAESLLLELVMQESFVPFLTLPAMDRLQSQSTEYSNMQQEIFFDKKFDFARTEGELEKSWSTEARWKGVKRPYSAAEVLKLQSRVNV
jgi:malate synthase